MNNKTTKELLNTGFKFITKTQNGLYVYAKMTGFEDNIQYTYIKDGVALGLMTTNMNQCFLMRKLYETFFK
ncbi:hypothetical protein [Clostridium sp. M14]|uniref:hypothetical protein n=1 Tax=Clostridium sp. M14 TaxID=2716311 RepID=UPI0013EED717|nr:hypothetical protein [Clostridium sp. M14]MBZ9693253.1 hypothetical protein [Clostridium sp. M14]